MGPVAGARDPSQWVQQEEQVQEGSKLGNVPVAPARDPSQWVPQEEQVQEGTKNGRIAPVAPARDPSKWAPILDSREFRNIPEKIYDADGKEIRIWPQLREQMMAEQPQEATKNSPQEEAKPKAGRKARSGDLGQQDQGTLTSSAPRARSNPQNLKVQTIEEAMNNPMVAGYIMPTDGSYNPGDAGGDRNTRASAPNAPSTPATSGPLDLTKYFRKTMGAESSGNPNAKNPRSSATGLFQFTSGTWKSMMRKHPELGLTADGRTDPAQQKRAMEKFTQGNLASLKKAGLPVTNGTLYLAHFAGDGGAKALLRADARTPVEQVLGPKAVAANPFLKGKTAGWTIKWAERKMA
jgi:hypothetical protein